MSKLNELLSELCPNGVCFRKLEDVAEIGTGSHNTNEGLTEGKYQLINC